VRIWDLAVIDLCERELLDSIDAQRARLARAACACRF